ncbi:unnamed protein product [Penicillium manginii]
MPSPYQYLKVPVRLGDMDVLVAAIGRRTTFSFQLELLLNSRLQQVGIITRRELVPTTTSIVRGMEQAVTLLTVVTELRVPHESEEFSGFDSDELSDESLAQPNASTSASRRGQPSFHSN